MVGRYHVDSGIVECPDQGLAVFAPLDGGVAFDPRPELVVPRLVEPEVMHAHLGGDAFVAPVTRRKQAHLHFRRQVQDVQQGVVLLRESRRERRRLQTGFRRPDGRMLTHRHVFAVLRPGRLLGFANHGRVLAMGQHDDGGIGEQLLECVRIVDQHVSCRRAHERLDPGGLADFQRPDLLDVAVGRTEVETEVGRAAADGRFVFIPERIPRGRLRTDVRHVHEARDATGDRGGRLGRKVAFPGEPGLPEVHLVIDHAGHQDRALRIVYLSGVVGGDAAGNLFDTFACDQYVAFENLALIEQAGIGDELFLHGSAAAN